METMDVTIISDWHREITSPTAAIIVQAIFDICLEEFIVRRANTFQRRKAEHMSYDGGQAAMTRPSSWTKVATSFESVKCWASSIDISTSTPDEASLATLQNDILV